MRRPVFHITVLYVDEEESIKRQMQRAAKVSAVVPSVPWRQHSFLVVYHFAHRVGAALWALPTVDTTLQMDKANQVVKDTGWGRLEAARATDVDEALARKRFRDFKHEVVDALNSIKEAFPFHLIAANGSPEDVKRAIAEEFAYQSSMDLGDDTFEMVRQAPVATVQQRRSRTD